MKIELHSFRYRERGFFTPYIHLHILPSVQLQIYKGYTFITISFLTFSIMIGIDYRKTQNDGCEASKGVR